jgi:ribosomal 30S subunit maturation factor RimM
MLVPFNSVTVLEVDIAQGRIVLATPEDLA